MEEVNLEMDGGLLNLLHFRLNEMVLASSNIGRRIDHHQQHRWILVKMHHLRASIANIPYIELLKKKFIWRHYSVDKGGESKSDHGVYWYDGRRGRAFDFLRNANYDQLLDMLYRVIGIDRNHYRVTLTTVAQTIRPSLPIEIIDDDDVALLLCREHVDPLVCISVEQINDDHPEVKQNLYPESPHHPHDATEYDF
ncbi:hypothetical protein Ddye_008572 [Dipteronia dyeriana]|uniref:Uncharacterized protein n=1 Tax=Dipteronia dyeriana TaxID=168575 RepID=A0AAD9XA18_9ROSI|nr:hypothetical protein Ddye_008572 [Dipteronia dyeriana]